MWIEVTVSSSTKYIIGACYHPPKPMYDNSELKRVVIADIDNILNADPDSVIIFADDINILNTDFLTVNFDFCSSE